MPDNAEIEWMEMVAMKMPRVRWTTQFAPDYKKPAVEEDDMESSRKSLVLDPLEIQKAKVNSLKDFYFNKVTAPPLNGYLPSIGHVNYFATKGSTKYGMVIGYMAGGKAHKSLEDIPVQIRSDFVRSYAVHSKHTDIIQVIAKEFQAPSTGFKQRKLGKPFVAITRSMGGQLNTDEGIIDALGFTKVRVKDSTTSSRVFGLAKEKLETVGKIYTEFSIRSGNVSKLKGSSWFAVLNVNGRSMKFCLCDLEFILPKMTAYNPPKDLTITKGDKVRVVKNHGCRNIPLGTEFEVTDVYKNGDGKKICSRSKTNRRDIVVGTNSNRSFKLYAECLKNIK